VTLAIPSHRAAAVIAVAMTLAGCAEDPILPGAPRVVERLAIAPYASQQQCVHLLFGDRLDWRYESSAPLGFEIRYEEDDAVLVPVVRERSVADNGTFDAREERDYCVRWEAGAAGAFLGYRLLLRRGRR